MQLQLFTEDPAYIYGIKPKEGEIFYIGSSKHDVKLRLQQHLTGVRTDKHVNRYLVNKINKIGVDNIEIVTLAIVSESMRYETEYALINKYIDSGKPLTNLKTEHSPRKYEKQDRFPADFDFLGEVMRFLKRPYNWQWHPVTQYTDLWITWYLNQLLYGPKQDWLQTQIDTLDFFLVKELVEISPRREHVVNATSPWKD